MNDTQSCPEQAWHAGLSVECLGHLIDSLNEALVVVEGGDTPMNDRIVYANRRFLELAQLHPEEIFKHCCTDFFEEDAICFLKEQSRIREETGSNRFEFFFPRKDGTRIPVIISLRFIKTRDGRQLSAVTCTDITEQKITQTKLEKANQLLREQKEELERDLSLAEKIQRSLIPDIKQIGPLQLATRYMPMLGIGGDYVFVHEEENGRVYLTVCDVAGHGVAASLVANFINAKVSSLLEKGVESPTDLLARLNGETYGKLQNPVMFFTFAAVQLDTLQGSASSACGGHPPVLQIHRDGSADRHSGPYPILGVFHPLPGKNLQNSGALRAGDRIVLYTDGITEAHSPGSEDLFGRERLTRLIVDNRHSDAEELADIIMDEVKTHSRNHVEDDVTLLVAAMD